MIYPTYVSAPYFEPLENHALKKIIRQTLEQLIQEILDKKLNRRKRVEGADYRVRAAHDLAPVFERVFGIKPKDLQKDKKFVKMLSTNGLELDERTARSGLGSKGLVGKKERTTPH